MCDQSRERDMSQKIFRTESAMKHTLSFCSGKESPGDIRKCQRIPKDFVRNDLRDSDKADCSGNP